MTFPNQIKSKILTLQKRMIRRSKYNNKKTIINGITFDSKKEGDRYVFLTRREEIGEILDLHLQVPFNFVLDGKKMFVYKSDFVYYDKTINKTIIEDVKGMRTPLYKLKKKLIEHQHQIKITET
jgi:hypothetical protein